MKKTLLMLILLINFTALSQNYPILRTVTIEQSLDENYNELNGDYIQDTNNLMNPYIGIWKYEENSITFIVKIQKATQFLSIHNDGSYEFNDKLIVTYKFIKNGVTLVDNLNEPLIDSYSNGNGKKYGRYWFNLSLDYISGIITDIPLNITTSSDIYPVNPVGGIFNKIKIQYNGMNSLRRNPEEFYEGKPTFMLPNFVELIKQ